MTAHDLDCEEVIRQLFAYLDGELEHDRLMNIDRHLEKCRDCFTRAEFERKLRAKVATAGQTTAPPKLRRRISGLIRRF